ncbi:response regulator transcription factor [Clostridium botulinum]|uniref:Stage 0 sporulation protein A homolog n=1 Tax=Clostridium botulinum TaxID=1491 RepID=A0A6M0V1G0_CLOBO|nr:response regulator transcription factor [Clostridium botulinum]NFE58294.1 response regulator transcription factor [Clostridium botulinum]NFF86642.1 response regulator transcription factor [Clostridium botulinum]NFG08866.1 response regulator transcription factor [Clostridium botulinum]
MGNILLVEDDRAVALAVIYSLKKEHFNVEHAINLRSAKNMITDDIDIILLDLMLPDGDGDGYELCTEIRQSGNDVPIIFMTACDEESNVVLGLDLGADDYVTKPVKMRELISRINAVLRRKGKNKVFEERKIIESEGILLDKGAHLVKKDGNEISLTLNEFKLLQFLMENSPNVLTRNTILEKLWDIEGNYIDANALSVYIKRLREKVEYDSRTPTLIETVRGVGYKWTPKVVK